MTKEKKDKTGNVFVVPSVTTILNVVGDPEALIKWALKETFKDIDWEKKEMGDYKKELQWLADIGTCFHEHAASVVMRRDPDLLRKGYDQILVDNIQYCIESFDEWVDRHEIEVLHVEQPFVSDVYLLGGTIDLIAKINGTTEIIDFKSGSVQEEKHKMQIVAYMMLARESGITVNQGRIVYCHRSKNRQLKEIVIYENEIKKYWDSVRAAKHLYQFLYSERKK